MRVELTLNDGKPIGYNLVPDNDEEKNTLKCIQQLHFITSNKQDKIEYDGVTVEEGKITRLFFMQRRYFQIPGYLQFKQMLLQICRKKDLEYKNQQKGAQT